MNRNLLCRWFERGRRTGTPAAPFALRLEALEDRNLLSSGLGALPLLGRTMVFLDRPAPARTAGRLVTTATTAPAPVLELTVTAVPALLPDVVVLLRGVPTPAVSDVVDGGLAPAVPPAADVGTVLTGTVGTVDTAVSDVVGALPAARNDAHPRVDRRGRVSDVVGALPAAPIPATDAPAAALPPLTAPTLPPSASQTVGVQPGGRDAPVVLPAAERLPAAVPVFSPVPNTEAVAARPASVAVLAAEQAARPSPLSFKVANTPASVAPDSPAPDVAVRAQGIQAAPAEAAPATSAAAAVSPSDAEAADLTIPGAAVPLPETSGTAGEVPSRGDDNETTLLEQVGGASPSSCVADEILTRVAYWTARSRAGEEPAPAPGSGRWALWLAPALAAAGIYFANRRYRRARANAGRSSALVLLR
jgi:hypothetical protein